MGYVWSAISNLLISFLFPFEIFSFCRIAPVSFSAILSPWPRPFPFLLLLLHVSYGVATMASIDIMAQSGDH